MLLKPRAISLQWVLIIPFVVQVVAAVSIVGYLSYKNGQQAVQHLADQLLDKTSQQVNQHLDNYLQIPLQLTQLNQGAIASGDLDLRDRGSSERYFWRQSKAFPSLGYVGYVLNGTSELGAGRWVKGLDIVMYENLPGPNNTIEALPDAQGNRAQILQTYDEDDSIAQWYKTTISQNKAIWKKQKITWSPIYIEPNVSNPQISAIGQQATTQTEDPITLDSEYISIAAVSPIYDAQGAIRGLLSADLMLNDISRMLNGLKVSPSGHTFIMERRSGMMIGSSSAAPIYHKVAGKFQQYRAKSSPDPVIQTIAQELERFPTLNTVQTPQRLKLKINGQAQYVQVTPWQDQNGLDWLVVVNVPEADFMAEIHANNRSTAILCLIALGTAIGLGLLTARWIIRPIRAINRATQNIAEGNIAVAIADSPIDELNTVGRSFNHMSQQLQTAFSDLERSNLELEARVLDRTIALSTTNRELNQTLAQLHQTQLQMIQAEKMSALGQMVAGVAHEINNPVNFIHGNLAHVSSYMAQLCDLVQTYQTHIPHPPTPVQVQVDAIDLDFLTADSTKILRSMELGTDRIRDIVLSLRNFSRLDEAEFKTVNLHEGIESTLLLLQHRCAATHHRSAIQITKDYGDLPPVECYPSHLNQVFLNILTNAIEALAASSVPTPKITIQTTRIETDQVRISITNNGMTIPAAIKSRLFDPFFTTKPIGNGTGMGLSISYQIITADHKGKLDCNCNPATGTEFTIAIPIRQTSPRQPV